MEKGKYLKSLLGILRSEKDIEIYNFILSLKKEIENGELTYRDLAVFITEKFQISQRHAYNKLKKLSQAPTEVGKLIEKAKENARLKIEKAKKEKYQKAKEIVKAVILEVLTAPKKPIRLKDIHNLLKEKGYKLTWREFKQVIEEIERELFGEESLKEKEPLRGGEKKEHPKVEKREEPSKGTERKQETPKRGYSLAIPDDFDWDSYAKTLAETNPEEWDLKPLLSLHPPRRRFRFLYYAVVPRIKDFSVFFRGIEKVFRKIGLKPDEYSDLVKMVYAWQNRKKKAELFDFDESLAVVRKYKEDFEKAIKKGIEIAKGGALD